jgi:hypothetical protein
MPRTSVKIVALAVLASLALTTAASAQQYPTQTPPSQVQPAPPQPVQAQPTQPELFQDTLKGQRAAEQSQGFYQGTAIAANTFYVPGKVITCAAGGAVSFVMMALTFGTGYKYMAGVLDEGCGGKWVLSADDMRPNRPASSFDYWDQRPR